MKRLLTLAVISALFQTYVFALSKNISSPWTIHYEENLKDKANSEIVHIAFSQWIVGQLKPCNCSMASYGGLENRERVLKNLKKYQNLLIFDLGNTFFPDHEVLAKFPENFKGADLNKNAQTLLKTYDRWGVNAVFLGRHENQKDLSSFKEAIKNPSLFSIISTNAQIKNPLPYWDYKLPQLQIRFLLLGHYEISTNHYEKLEQHLLKDGLNIFVGDASFSELSDLSKQLKLNGDFLYLGSGDEINLYKPVKAGNFTQVIGAFRNQNWMLSKLVMDIKNKKLWIDTQSIQSWVEKTKSKKKTSKSK